MRSILKIGVVAVILIMAGAYAWFGMTASDDNQVTKDLKGVADRINASLPKNIDEITTATNASVDGHILTYHYKLSRRDGSDDELRAFAKSNTVKQACQTAGMRNGMKQNGLTYRYSFMLPDASQPISVDATDTECTKLGF